MKKLALVATLAAALLAPAAASARTSYVVPDGFYGYTSPKGEPLVVAGFDMRSRKISHLSYVVPLHCHSDGDPDTEIHTVAFTGRLTGPLPDRVSRSTGELELTYLDAHSERHAEATLSFSFRDGRPTLGIGLKTDGSIEHCSSNTLLTLTRSARLPAHHPA